MILNAKLIPTFQKNSVKDNVIQFLHLYFFRLSQPSWSLGQFKLDYKTFFLYEYPI